MDSGVMIGQTKMSWFGQSNSQIKQKSFWFIVEEIGVESKKSAQARMGDFDKIKDIEKAPLKK